MHKNLGGAYWLRAASLLNLYNFPSVSFIFAAKPVYKAPHLTLDTKEHAMPEGTPRHDVSAPRDRLSKSWTPFGASSSLSAALQRSLPSWACAFSSSWKSAPSSSRPTSSVKQAPKLPYVIPNSALLMMREDEYRQLAFTIKEDGTYASWALDSGEQLRTGIAQPALEQKAKPLPYGPKPPSTTCLIMI